MKPSLLSNDFPQKPVPPREPVAFYTYLKFNEVMQKFINSDYDHNSNYTPGLSEPCNVQDFCDWLCELSANDILTITVDIDPIHMSSKHIVKNCSFVFKPTKEDAELAAKTYKQNLAKYEEQVKSYDEICLKFIQDKVSNLESEINALKQKEIEIKNNFNTEDLNKTILDLISKNKFTSQELREKLIFLWFKEYAIRSAVANLWDAGLINVEFNQVLAVLK
jgi:hypothetical protein